MSPLGRAGVVLCVSETQTMRVLRELTIDAMVNAFV